MLCSLHSERFIAEHPFGIFSAPGCYQKIMGDITQDLLSVMVYLGDIEVSGKNAEDYLHNLKQDLEYLSARGF